MLYWGAGRWLRWIWCGSEAACTWDLGVTGGHWIVSWADSSYIRYLLYDVLPKVIPKNVFHDDNGMILKYKHGETWDCIGWWFLHWYLIWNIKNGYTELDNFDVYLLTRNQICTHCVRNYSEACTDVIWTVMLASEQMIDYWGIKTDDLLLRHNCCCIVKNRICVGIFIKQLPRVGNVVETVTRIFKTLCQKWTYVMYGKKHHNNWLFFVIFCVCKNNPLQQNEGFVISQIWLHILG